MTSTAVASRSMATMTRDRRLTVMLAGLLLGSPVAVAEVARGDWVLSEDHGALHLRAQDAPRADVVRALAQRFNLIVVEHAELAGTVTVEMDGGSLHDAVSLLLKDRFSFQLYTQEPNDASQLLPSTLWVFPSGSARPSAATVLFEAVLYEGSRKQKLRAIDGLRRVAAPDAVHTVAIALGDDDPRVREAAVRVLEEEGSGAALAALASASASPEVAVRARVAEALASGGSESAVRYLGLAIDDKDPRVRLEVIDSLADMPLGSVPSSSVIGLLEAALNDQSLEVRLQALDALEEFGGGVAYAALRAQEERAEAARPPEQSFEQPFE